MIAEQDTHTAADDPSDRWADRGWWLAFQYGVLARDKFLKRLPRLRGLGAFKELLEPGGRIVYRNLFREREVEAAWDLLTALRPWHDRLTCYLRGDEVSLKTAQDVLWCAAFLGAERPCRGGAKKKERPVGCPGAQVLLGPGGWELAEDERRHLLTFSEVTPTGLLRFDRSALAEFLSRSRMAQRCPRSPARDPDRLAAAFPEVPVRALAWPLVAALDPEVRRRIGAKALEKEHGFVLREDLEELEAHVTLELSASGEAPEDVTIGLAGQDAPPVGQDVRLPVAVRRVLAEGVRLRAVRMDEAYVRRPGGHYEVEQRFVLSTRFPLLPTDRPETFRGYRLTTHPRATPEYAAWVDRVVEGLP